MIYLTEGNIPLNAAYDDNIVQEANSTYQLTFKFPTNNILWQKLREETFLIADDLHGEQDFVIFEVEKKHGYIQVYANQVMTLLNNYVVNPISLDRQTGSTALSRFAGSITRSNPFSFFSDIEDRHTFNIDSKNAMDAFAKDKHSILGLWGGDLVRHGYQVRLLKNGGSENESLFMYQKNLSSYEHKTSTKSLRTRITFITTIRGEGEKPADKHYKVVVDSPLINKYNQIYEDVVEVNDQDVVDEATLLKYGKQYFRTTLCDMLEDSIEIDVIGQSDVPVQMYDVVSVYHEQFDLDVRKKITKYNYSPMAKKLKSIGFGDFKSGLANAIGNAVSDAVKNETQHLQGQFATQLAKEIKNADLAFDRQKEELVNRFTDGINAANARAEEVKRQLSDTIDQRFRDFDSAGLREARQKADEALTKAGASNSLAEEAKRISEQAKDGIEKAKESFNDLFKAESAFTNNLDEKLKKFRLDHAEFRRSTKEDIKGLTESFTKLGSDTKSDILATRTEFQKTAEGLTQRFESITSQLDNKANLLDFQRVQETSKLYERIIGSSESDITEKVARMTLTNQLFQVEVGKYANVGGPNMLRNSRADDELKYWIEANGRLGFTAHSFYFNGQKRMFELRPGAVVKSPRFIVKRNTDYTLNILAFDNNSKYFRVYFCKRVKGSVSDYQEKTLIFNGQPRWVDGAVFDNGSTVKKSVTFNVGNFDEGYLQFEYDRNNPNKWGGLFMTELDFYEGTTDRKWQPAPEDATLETDKTLEATQTKMTQLAGSWAVQNINNAGDLVSGLNLGANGHNRLDGKLTHITGETLIDNAVIKSAMIDKLKTANFETGSVTTAILDAESVTADKLRVDQALFNKLLANEAYLNQLFSKQAFINRVQSVSIDASQIRAGVLMGASITSLDDSMRIDTNKKEFYLNNNTLFTFFDQKEGMHSFIGTGSRAVNGSGSGILIGTGLDSGSTSQLRNNTSNRDLWSARDGMSSSLLIGSKKNGNGQAWITTNGGIYLSASKSKNETGAELRLGDVLGRHFENKAVLTADDVLISSSNSRIYSSGKMEITGGTGSRLKTSTVTTDNLYLKNKDLVAYFNNLADFVVRIAQNAGWSNVGNYKI